MDGSDFRSRIPADTDVVLAVNNRCFYTNRGRLARSSPYFEAMFNSRMIESQSEIIELKGVCHRSVKALIDFVNNSSFPDVSEDVLPLLEAASMYQFDVVRDKCVEYLKSNCNISTCVAMMYLSDRFGLPTLHLQAKQIALWNFDLVVDTSEFLDLPLDALMDYLSRDDLNVPRELVVFQGIARWIGRDVEKRLPFVDEELVSVVRFSAIDLRDLKILAHEPLVLKCPWFRRVIHEIWKIKFNHYLEERKSKGASSSSISPLSSISPAEHSQSARDQHGEEGDVAMVDDGDTGNACFSGDSPNGVAALNSDFSSVPVEQDGVEAKNRQMDDRLLKVVGYAAVTDAIKMERIMALRLLTARPRSVPIIPAVVLYNERDKSKLPAVIGYDYDRQVFLELGAMTKAVQNARVAFGFRAIAVGNFVYIIGGDFLLGHGNWNNAVWRFNTFTKMWTFLVNMREPRRHHAVCILDDFLYLIGGTSRFRVLTDSVEKLHLPTGNWSDAARLPKVIHTAACTTHQGKIYVVETCVYRYDPTFDMWCCMEVSPFLSMVSLNAAMSHPTGIYFVECDDGQLVRYLPIGSRGSGGHVEEGESPKDKEGFQVVGKFTNPSVNACIVGDKIYSFSKTDFLVVESYSIASNMFAIEMESNDPTYRGATYSYGCFSLPKYT